MQTFKNAKTGDKVWNIRTGWTKIRAIVDCSMYPIIINNGSYTIDGKIDASDINPLIFWDKIEINIPKQPLPKLEIDTKVIVWGEPDQKVKRYFSHFNENGNICCFNNGTTSWSYSANHHTAVAWINWELANEM